MLEYQMSLNPCCLPRVGVLVPAYFFALELYCCICLAGRLMWASQPAVDLQSCSRVPLASSRVAARVGVAQPGALSGGQSRAEQPGKLQEAWLGGQSLG